MKRNDLPKQTSKLAAKMPFTHAINESVLENAASGMLSTTIEFKGVYAATLEAKEINNFTWYINNCFSKFSDEYALYFHVIRKKTGQEPLTYNFKTSYAQALNDKHFAKFKSDDSGSYRNRFYMTICYRGFSSGKMNKLAKFATVFTRKIVKDSRAAYREFALDKLLKKRAEVLSKLAAFTPSILMLSDNSGYSPLLSFYRKISCFSDIPVRTPKSNYFYEEFETDVKLVGKNEYAVDKELTDNLEMNLRHIVPNKNISFGDYGLISNNINDSVDLYASVIGLKNYAEEVDSFFVDDLLKTNTEFVYTTSFLPELQDVMMAKIQNKISYEEKNHPDEHKKIANLKECLAAVKSGELTFGKSHTSVTVFNKNRDTLDQDLLTLCKVFDDNETTAVGEGINKRASFFAQIPGNMQMIGRTRILGSDVIANLFPMHTFPTGYYDKNHLGKALTMLQTEALTPVYFNFHRKGSGDKLDLPSGHSFFIANSSSGKTVIMNFLNAQFERYQGKRIIIERDPASAAHVFALGGKYICFEPENAPKMNPFQIDKTPDNLAFLNSWVELLCLERGEDSLPSSDRRILTQAIADVMELPKKGRKLSYLFDYLGSEFNRIDALQRYCKGRDGESDGQYAYLFDNDEDYISLDGDIIGYDLAALQDQGNDSNLAAVMDYIFFMVSNYAKNNADNRPIMLQFDEASRLFDHPYWHKNLKTGLVTWRKHNIFAVFATQELNHILKSAISSTILSQTVTKVYFPNQAGDPEEYKKCGLNDSQIEWVLNTHEKVHKFLYCNSDEVIICDKDLSCLGDDLSLLSIPVALAKKTIELGNSAKSPDNFRNKFLKMKRGYDNE